MHHRDPLPPRSRRDRLTRIGAGLGSLGLASLLANGNPRAASAGGAAPLAARPPQVPTKGRHVIQRVMPDGTTCLGLHAIRALVSAFLFACAVVGVAFPARAADPASEEFFEKQIRPILAGTCFRCHGDLKKSGELRIDSREALLKGGDSGPAIVPGDPEESLLIRAIQRQEDVSAMPPEKEMTLRPDQIAAFVAWIKAGAGWPPKTAKFTAPKHWAFEPIRDVAPPDVQDKAWVKTSIDAFIRSKQEATGVHPAPPSNKLALIRRATFDLTGLPPTPDEVKAFESDPSPRAFAAVVDRLLGSPAYGERWGRHWLDVVRYADTAGETADYPVPLAWRYRNYVIEAFNADKPYDEFLREQIAGDILARQGSRDRYAERATATGYLAISRRFGFDSEKYQHLVIQDTIDTLGQSVLGLGLGCARCHDHKFDPISMTDYYALYGIFESSRYAFPGSEQKQKVRAMMPLIPANESQPKLREFDSRVAALMLKLENQKQPAPAAVLGSLDDFDGDFQLQAAAAGGSNGVLVPPWIYEGKVAVTNAAQSPFKNLYPRGTVGASVPGGAGAYRIAQALYPARTRDQCRVLHVNLDFRVGAPDAGAKGMHSFWIGARAASHVAAPAASEPGAAAESPATEVLISSEAVFLRTGETIERICALKPKRWHNLQLTFDLENRTVSGSVGIPDNATHFSSKPLLPGWSGSMDFVAMDSRGQTGAALPPIEYDNFAAQEAPIPPLSTVPPAVAAAASQPNQAALAKQLQELTASDADFELQVDGTPPSNPWGAGPNSVVKISAVSQSPHRNVFAEGELGIHMPNRGEYDGFGQWLTSRKSDKHARLYASFDFRCANEEAGGDGTWRFYLGHGGGTSAAVELFFNGSKFFRRSGDVREAVCPLRIGEWYQVQLTLDLKNKSYTGVIASLAGSSEFAGQFASGWDGTIDYTFIDSYGHVGGVRPALDTDNFVVGETAIPPLGTSPAQIAGDGRESRRAKVSEIRQQLSARPADAEKVKQELNALLAEGPFEMTYGVVEGMPHNARLQMRGEPDHPGVEAPRGFIKALGGGPLAADAQGSGRLELAEWLTRPDNPLCARVMVNRIWQYHFGRGIVKTPNDFGGRGQPPTHSELLDYLATQFIRSGWSVKSMHRLMMLSATYQQSCDADATTLGAKPGTDVFDLYTSFSRRRLSAEELRDSILAISGELDPTPGREHPFPPPASWGYTQHAPFGAVYDHNKRSVYLMTQRNKRHPFLALFDGADPNTTTAERRTTTVPTQALFFLNDPFVHAKAENCAARLQAARSDEGSRILLACQLAFGRSPTDVELREAASFLAAYRAELAATGQHNVELRALAAYVRTLFGSNEFLHVD